MSFVLAPDEDLDHLRERVQAAVASSGRFVQFQLAGHRTASVLITPRSRIVLVTEDVDDEGEERASMSLNDEGNWDLL